MFDYETHHRVLRRPTDPFSDAARFPSLGQDQQNDLAAAGAAFSAAAGSEYGSVASRNNPIQYGSVFSRNMPGVYDALTDTSGGGLPRRASTQFAAAADTQPDATTRYAQPDATTRYAQRFGYAPSAGATPPPPPNLSSPSSPTRIPRRSFVNGTPTYDYGN